MLEILNHILTEICFTVFQQKLKCCILDVICDMIEATHVKLTLPVAVEYLVFINVHLRVLV